MKRSFAWIAANEATNEEGFYLEDSPELREKERAQLKEWGAPDTEQIEFVSILPEDRDEAMVEAKVTEAFIAWAKSHADAKGEVTEPVENGISNIVYYDNEEN
jgi:hypothetical protein